MSRYSDNKILEYWTKYLCFHIPTKKNKGGSVCQQIVISKNLPLKVLCVGDSQ